ncbi:PPOX class F420-dependent oxidoreductase [Rhodococcoides fascians]|uniref:PPOX class F420-dependent oxidoreductase n=1 Tax=Rhodococcoides fascians TaxID=1828 RepID=UPI000562E653|nr:PPOX class F420-dependent oxidoreductase [Rhodococcus fascians]
MTASFLALGDQPFVSLTTFRRSGEPVSTPVWIGRDRDELIVLTPTDSGKVKRIRNSGRVELRLCNRRGKVPDDVVTHAGTARIVTDEPARRATELIRQKYGVEFRIVMLIERVVARGRKPRVILAIDGG